VPGWATPATCSSSPPRISEDNLAAERRTPAAGDAIHAGISSRDPIVTMLTGSTSKGKDYAAAAKELKQAAGKRPEAPTVEKASSSPRRARWSTAWRW
jgi:hypothetical protein